jgi:hypothetical protein
VLIAIKAPKPSANTTMRFAAEYVAAIQSLLVTCKLHNIDPYTYLVDVLQRVDEHPNDKVHELTPRLWKDKFAANPLRSDLYRRG